MVIDHDRLSEAELLNGGGHGFDRVVIVTGIVFIGPDRRDGSLFDVHEGLPNKRMVFSAWQ